MTPEVPKVCPPSYRMFGSRRWIRESALPYGHWIRKGHEYRHITTTSSTEVRRRLRSRPLTRIRDGHQYVISGEARKALEMNGKGMLKEHALDDLAYWKCRGWRVLLVPNGGSRYLLYLGVGR